jgi:tetratricopeptide (TPR) repeat protein
MRAETGRRRSRAAGTLLAALLIGCCPLSCRADTAAGSAAFEKGDYVRAMAEWASAAERGDPDAEYGLGMLYERGDNQLKQDYKQADRWYEKAAEHGHIGAEYRLALIYAAGGDNFPAQPVEAYKWILLASEKGLATDVKAQLEKILDRGQLADAQKRATAWKAAHAESAVATAPASGGTASPALPPPRPSGTAPSAATGKSGGCPGWPFPTLPCTEQFPAFGGAPAKPTPALPPPRAD